MWQPGESKWLAIKVSSAVVILSILGLSSVPVYRSLKAWRARHLAEQSSKLLIAQNPREAQRKAHAAYLLGPDQADALRAAARVQAAVGHPNALVFWQRLIALNLATPDDRRDYVELCLKLGFLPQAQVELQKLILDAPNDAPNLWLFSQLCLARRDVGQCIEFASQALAKDPANRRYQLFLSSIQFDGSDDAATERHRKMVWEIARGQDGLALEALVFLAHRTDLVPAQIRELIQLLEKHPSFHTPQYLLALDLKVRIDNKRKAELLKVAADHFRPLPPEDLNQFVAWLNTRQEFEQTLQVLPLDEARKRRDSFILRMEALGGLGRWAEVDAILDKTDLPLSPTVLQAFRARVAAQLNKPEEAGFSWRRALQAAGDNPEELQFLGDYARKNREVGHATRAYRALIKVAPDSLAGYVALSELLQADGTTTELRDLMREMASKWPQNPAFRNDLAYLNLLLGTDLENARKTAEELVRQAPQYLALRTTLALANLRLNDPAAAAQAYSGASYDWTKAMPAHQAVYAAVLTATGKTNEATRILASLPLDTLHKEERALVGE